MSGRTVWVLGAGFSKPLGGPLLSDLFQPEREKDLPLSFPEIPAVSGSEARAAIRFYNYGRAFDGCDAAYRRGQTGEHLWWNAEEFLDSVERAAEAPHSPHGVRIETAYAICIEGVHSVPRFSSEVAATTRRIFAAETSMFLVGQDPNSERWLAHRRWLGTVARNDVILTFNYDLVVERLAESTGVPLQVVVPGDPEHPDRAQLYKLHGSVDWRATSSGTIERSNSDTALKCPADEIAIASPGPKKMQFTRNAEAMKGYWKEAMAHLHSASAIVFVGYRFPPSDGWARSQILGAIRDNSSLYLPIHLVLGPPNADTQRLLRLLRYAIIRREKLPAGYPAPQGSSGGRRYFNIVPQPLFAEEFFDVATSGIITQPTQNEFFE